MEDNLAKSVVLVLKSEGGYTNHPQDPGGATNYGVLQRVYDSWRRSKGLIPRSVKLIEMDEVRAIYKENYWDLVKGDKLPIGIDYLVFDACINSGPHQAVLWLQRAINALHDANRLLTVDGSIGAMTLDYVDDVDPIKLIDNYLDQRLGFMKVIRNKATHELLWKYFGKGWDARLFGEIDPRTGVRAENGVDDNAKAMIQLSPTKPTALGPVSKPILNDAPKPVPTKDIESFPWKTVIAALGAVLALIATKLGLYH